MGVKETFGIFSSVITLMAYGPYIYLILHRKIKPHIFSWVLWGSVNCIAFAAQFSQGAGPGAWPTGLTGVICIGIAVLSLSHGEKHITRGDWLAFVIALLAIPIWRLTHNPLWAVVIAVFIDATGCYVTLRKSYGKPNEEMITAFFLCGLRAFVALFALKDYSLVTALYPAYAVVSNNTIVVILLWRRRIERRGKA